MPKWGDSIISTHAPPDDRGRCFARCQGVSASTFGRNNTRQRRVRSFLRADAASLPSNLNINMEFRCRLGTPGGRSSKGFTSRTAKTGCVASWKRRVFTSCHCSAARACRRQFDSAADAAAVSADRFLVFQPELATLLKAGSRWSSRSTSASACRTPFKAVLDAI